MDEQEAQMLADVDRFGWTVMKITNDMGPDFAYSVGMFRTLEHPELIMFGLELDTMHRIINEVGAAVRDGFRAEAGTTSDRFLKGYDVTFRAVPRYQYRGHIGWDTWLYNGEDFPALQLIWPDRDGRWPWEDGITDWFRTTQPVLADIPVPRWAE